MQGNEFPTVKGMRSNMKSDLNPVGQNSNQESMLAAIKNKRKGNALKLNLATTSQSPLNLPTNPSKIKGTGDFTP
jgi:hypothetical protein